MKKILIIEDDQVIANIYRNKFSVEGFNVEVAFDGEVGLEMVKAFRPDLIVLDLMLPKVTGVEIIKLVRGQPEFEKTPILVFSNTYLTNLVQDAWKAGATKCLSKSNCTPRHLLEAVRAALGVAVAVEKAVSAPSASAAAAPGVDPAEQEFQSGLHREFIASLPGNLTALRASLKSLVKADNDTARLQQMQLLYHRIHPLTGNAAVAGLVHIAQMGDALEFLLKELIEKPKNLNV
jgi:two-component system alkaline phosphatase synthesis response regulator PhoP